MEEIDHIAELQKRLYTRDPDNAPKRKYGILHPIKTSAQSTWGETELPEEKVVHHRTARGYKRFFVGALLFFLAALGVALFSLYRGALTLSSKNVDVMILGNSFVAGGEELPIQVEIANKNAADLVDATLTLYYPKGATDETGTDVVRIERPMGTIGSGKTKSEEFTVILYGEQGISRTLTATLSYKLAGSSASFEKESTFSVMVSSSPVGLTVDAPTGVVSGQPFTLTIRNTFSGDKLLPNVIARIEYPNGFVFQSTNQEPVSGTNVWNLGDLEKGDERTITVTGKIIGEVLDEKAFRIYIGTPEDESSSKIAVAYNSALATLRVIEPFLAGTITVQQQGDDIIALRIGDTINGVVSWVNNSAFTITKPTFTLQLGGAPIDPSSISAPNSYYDDVTDSIIWNSDSNTSLAFLGPGVKGELPFSFKPLGATNSDVTLGLSLTGTIPDQGNIVQSIDTIDQKIVRFASSIQFAAQSLYSIGPITNSGPYPPKADMETSYTLRWTILPTDNPLAAVTASAILPPSVTWTGNIVPSTETITYNADTRVLTWNIGPLPKATSTAKSKSVSFQVKVKPTKSQVGSTVSLLGETIVSATDTVTETTIESKKPPLTTRFDTDPIYTEGADRVVP